MAIETSARRVIEEKGEPTCERMKDFTKPDLDLLHKWRVKKPIKSANKAVVLAAILSAPPPEPLTDWTKDEEDRLHQLLHGEIKFKDAALGVALKQKAKAVRHNVSELDKEEATELLQALQQQLQDTEAGNSTHGNI